MESLSLREKELVSIGAALGSNCIPCVEYHIPMAKKAGLTDSQINEAVKIADKVRKVPSDKVLNVALGLIAESDIDISDDHVACGCKKI